MAPPKRALRLDVSGRPTNLQASAQPTPSSSLSYTPQTCSNDSLNTLAICIVVLRPHTRARTVPGRAGWNMDDQVEESADRASMIMSCLADGVKTNLTFLSRASTIPSQTASPSLNSPASPTLSRKMATMKKPTTAPFPTVTFPLLLHSPVIPSKSRQQRHPNAPPHSSSGNTESIPSPATAPSSCSPSASTAAKSCPRPAPTTNPCTPATNRPN